MMGSDASSWVDIVPLRFTAATIVRTEVSTNARTPRVISRFVAARVGAVAPANPVARLTPPNAVVSRSLLNPPGRTGRGWSRVVSPLRASLRLRDARAA